MLFTLHNFKVTSRYEDNLVLTTGKANAAPVDTREKRMLHKQKLISTLEAAKDAEGLLYEVLLTDFKRKNKYFSRLYAFLRHRE